ncbi:putative 37S ribosomal protein S26A, mitochondrial [Grifola frondosa]|uniref:Putative 37S ribosomal protein S26A, mitochondrial n=1 Tax=Grifola frondosa TaxID=5627 RepID=A0A1C7M4V7_GRIFR|nr:putative 37S ribosomal protein S26A, mitochondrial [Grifola frondosa]
MVSGRLLDRLNDQVKGTSLENKSVVQTVVEAARDPDKVLEFNYACEALNNSFFLESLKPPPADATSHEAALSTEIFFHNLRVTWGTLSHLKSCFSAAVLGMFSSGYVWLVCDQFGSLGILPTFGAGTLLVRSGLSQVTVDYQKVVGEFILRSTKAAHPDNAPPASSPQSPSGASSEPAPTSPASGLSHAPPPLNPHTPARSFSSTLSPHVVQPRAASVYKTGDSRPPSWTAITSAE